MDLISEKLDQATGLVQAAGVDAWLTLVRETSAGGDPVLPFLMEGGLVWDSALVVFPNGERTAIVGRYDAEPLEKAGHWSMVVGYDQSVWPDLKDALANAKKVAVNFSDNDVMADGLSHGMYRRLVANLPEISFVSAEGIVGPLRGVKTSTEVKRIHAAIAETDRMFGDIIAAAQPGTSEREIYDRVHHLAKARGLGFSWDPAGDPIVNCGPDSMIGHGIPSAAIRLSKGQIFHIDLGLVKEGYSSDIQRCWFVGDEIPPEVSQAFEAVVAAIDAAANVLRPGVKGVEVDAAARASITESGYPEHQHAVGHQVGRGAHDGGAILGPAWERYGDTPFRPVREGEIYTLELGVNVEGRGYLGLEEMVRVSQDGIEWLSDRQLDLPLLRG
ncbi:aminopeptidase P family protein [bacterium]|nr:MAG: aminopeptidase P family protein [bacterium]